MPGESHGQRSLKGYSPKGRRELDTTEATWRACTLYKEREERMTGSQLCFQDDLLRSSMILCLSSNKSVCCRSVFHVTSVDEFRNGKGEISSATSVGIANKQLLSWRPLTGKAASVSLHFARSHRVSLSCGCNVRQSKKSGHAFSGKRVLMLNRGGDHATLTSRCQHVRV